MQRAQRIRIAETLVENFNFGCPIGTPVRFWTGAREGEGRTGKTWTPAQLMSESVPVVYIRDDSGKNVGCIGLTHVAPILTAENAAPSSEEQSPPKEEETFLETGKQ